MTPTSIMVLAVFLGTISLVALLSLLLGGKRNRLDDRLDELAGKQAPVLEQAGADVKKQAVQNLSKLGKHLVTEDTEELSRLKARMVHAGLYSSQAFLVLLGVKMLLMVGPALIGLALAASGVVSMKNGLVAGGVASLLGMVGPSFWLDRRKAQRQLQLRRSLPDALDLIIICVDGGLSLPGALSRVVSEIEVPHPLLAGELNIVQREIQLGHPTAEALKSFSKRCDLEEVRSLSATVQNAERFGASMVKSLKTFADTLRQKRQQQAEEMAQKAGVKTLFPTLFFIFPSIFVIILGPAAMRVVKMMSEMNK